MSILDKLRAVQTSEPIRRVAEPSAMRPAPPRLAGLARPSGHENSETRLSNGLKEFLWHLDGIGKGQLLDLGPAWQTTITYFIERGFKVYTENLLTSWSVFLDAENKRLRELADKGDSSEATPSARAERFLQNALCYPKRSFDAILAWDAMDYLEGELASRVVERMSSLVRDGGVVLAVFHARKPEGFRRYRVLDGQNLELMPDTYPLPVQHIYQNREISNLFSEFRSSKSFVGRDQLREGLYVK